MSLKLKTEREKIKEMEDVLEKTAAEKSGIALSEWKQGLLL